MTTDCASQFDFAPHREAADHREHIAAAVTAVAYVLLLPGAVLLMSLLSV